MEENIKNFQLEEYKNISNAHFETNKQIALFFRYYLLIASAPAIILSIFSADEITFGELINANVEFNYTLFIGFFLIAVSIIGLLICFYVISIKLDNILYARTINGIRKFFFHNNTIPNESAYRVLPKLTNMPSYRQTHNFSIVVWSFALINSIYFSLGCRIIASHGNKLFVELLGLPHWIIIKNFGIWYTIIVFILFGLLHIIYYWFISNYRNFRYMRNLIIGIDIDGVMNKHREIFCTMLWQKKGKTLWADDITKIPVHLLKGKEITRDDEFDIFNDPEYWKNQELLENNIGKYIKELKNDFGYRINIHSYRPWPQSSYGTLSKESLKNTWKRKSLKKITKDWLKQHEIPYNDLFIEKTGIDVTSANFSLVGFIFGIAKSNFRNRFFYTRKKSYRYFIEDTIENAIKLSRNCEYVFLLNQPYNNSNNALPSNVIRVKNWIEIREKIRELG